jgi:NAD kinase
MERRVSMCSSITFKRPLIVYKLGSEIAYKYTLKLVEEILKQVDIVEIYVEYEDISIENILKHKEENEEESMKTIDSLRHKIKLFKLGETIPDLCICLGGDGTTLWCNNLLKNQPRPPFLTFHLGTLGYMAIYKCDQFKEVIKELFAPCKKISYEKRGMISCKINRSKQDLDSICTSTECILEDKSKLNLEVESSTEVTALNDIIIEKGFNVNVISLKIYINDEPLTIVKCDGLILSTSTGSTAYNLSAGGPVVHYDVDALILNAICPHSLSFRSITFPKHIVIKIVPCPVSYNKTYVYCDGKNVQNLDEHTYVEIALSNEYVEFIILENLVCDRVSLWKKKIIEQLGWNNAFQSA